MPLFAEWKCKISKPLNLNTMNKFVEFVNQYDTVSYERMINENDLYTLNERISFEQEYHQRRQEEEVSYLKQIQVDVNKEFKQNEFGKCRSIISLLDLSEDDEESNAIRLSEFEVLYKSKLETIQEEVRQRDEQQTKKPAEVRQVLDSTKKEHRTESISPGEIRTTRNGSSWNHRTKPTGLREDRS